MTNNTSPSITIITSIPPVCPSRSVDGSDIGGAYRQACVDSWQRFAERIVSVNSCNEAQAVAAANSGVAVRSVESDGMAVAGRPLVLFDALLQCAVEEKTDLIALTNSDIFLADAAVLRQQAELLQSGEAMVSRRVNVQSLHNLTGASYKWGYDLFVLRREDIAKLYRETTLFFGEPWWDYYFLSNIVLNGMAVKPTDSSHVLHLAHKEAYSSDRWLATGTFSLKILQDNIEAGRISSDAAAQLFSDTVMNASDVLPVKDAIQLAMKNIRALSLYHVMLFYKFVPEKKAPQENDLHLFSCALTAYAELKINFGSSSRERIKKACGELNARMRR